jgi:hypothetical protein
MVNRLGWERIGVGEDKSAPNFQLFRMEWLADVVGDPTSTRALVRDNHHEPPLRPVLKHFRVPQPG